MQRTAHRLPKNAEIKVNLMYLQIENHRVVNMVQPSIGLLGWMFDTIQLGYWNEMLIQFKKHRITFDVVINTCIAELDNNPDGLTYYMSYVSRRGGNLWDIMNFVSGKQGMLISRQIITKLQSCRGWKDLREIMLSKNKFRRGLNRKIKAELKIYYETSKKQKDESQVC